MMACRSPVGGCCFQRTVSVAAEAVGRRQSAACPSVPSRWATYIFPVAKWSSPVLQACLPSKCRGNHSVIRSYFLSSRPGGQHGRITPVNRRWTGRLGFSKRGSRTSHRATSALLSIQCALIHTVHCLISTPTDRKGAVTQQMQRPIVREPGHGRRGVLYEYWGYSVIPRDVRGAYGSHNPSNRAPGEVQGIVRPTRRSSVLDERRRAGTSHRA